MKTTSSIAKATRLALTLFVLSLNLAGLDARANDRAWEVLTNFPPNVGPQDGSPLVQGTGGYFGTTSTGGSNGLGAVFEITSAGVCTEIFSFNETDGGSPIGGLVSGGDGFFYGTTLFGGTNGGGGTVFKITPGGMLTTLHSFTGGNDGYFPNAGLVKGSGGLFYGTTYFGGSNGYGGIYSVTSGGQLTELYSFTNGTDGQNVSTVLTVSGGNLYGASQYGGSVNNAGTIFKMTPAGGLTVLYTFTNGADGANPAGGLALDALGNFYGVSEGGTNGNGVAFTMTPAGALTVLYSFTGGADGSTPGAPLTVGSDSNFYGTTLYSGEFFGGTAFQLTPTGTLTTLVRFNQAASGGAPGALIQGSDSNFYGLAIYGGAYSGGTVFKFAFSNTQPGLQDLIPMSEYDALTNLYNSTGGDAWNQKFGWLDGAADYWFGVTVASPQYDTNWNLAGVTHTIELNLGYNNLVGAFPSAIGNLPALIQIALNNNGLTGSLPGSLTNLTQLTSFTANLNLLSGGIPTGLGNLSSLQYLDLSYNELGGAIPSGLGNLTNLQNLYLKVNALTGSLPGTLTNLSALQALSVSENVLTGTLPGGLGALAQLTDLDLSSNGFSGSIPGDLGALTLLTNFSVGDNQFSGAIPNEFAGLTNLQTAVFFSNQLSGTLPAFSAPFLDVTWNDFDFDTDSTNYDAALDMIDNGQTVIYLPQYIPTILEEPSDVNVPVEHSTNFIASIENGTTFQWVFNGQPLTNGPLVADFQTIALRLESMQSSNAGTYNVIVSNTYGSVTSLAATLVVGGVPVSFNPASLAYANGHFTVQITNLVNQGPVVIDASTNLTQWTPVFTNPSGSGTFTFTDSNAAGFPHRFYRATVAP